MSTMSDGAGPSTISGGLRPSPPPPTSLRSTRPRYGEKAALGFLQFPEGVDWDGKTAHVVIPIASNSGEHVGILQALAVTISDKATMERLKTTTSVDEVLDLLTPEED